MVKIVVVIVLKVAAVLVSSILCTNISSCTYISYIFSCSDITCPFYLYFSKTSINNCTYNTRRTSRYYVKIVVVATVKQIVVV